MFNRESQPIITELVVESADSKIELADSSADSSPDLARIGVWVREFMNTCNSLGEGGPVNSMQDIFAAGLGSIPQGVGWTTFPCCHSNPICFTISPIQKQQSESVQI